MSCSITLCLILLRRGLPLNLKLVWWLTSPTNLPVSALHNAAAQAPTAMPIFSVAPPNPHWGSHACPAGVPAHWAILPAFRHISKTGPFMASGAHQIGDWLANKPWGHSVSAFYFLSSEMQTCAHHFYVGARNENSSLHICPAGTSLGEISSPQWHQSFTSITWLEIKYTPKRVLYYPMIRGVAWWMTIIVPSGPSAEIRAGP